MGAIIKWAAVAVLLLVCTGCDKAKEWLDFGEAQKELPEKRDPAQSIQPLQTGEWRFDPQPVRLGFAANWKNVKVSLTPSVKPSSGESDQASTSSSNSTDSSSSSSQDDQANKQPEKSVAPSFVCAFNQEDKLFCGKLQRDIAMVRMVEVQGLPQNSDPTQLKVSAGHVCVETNDHKLSCGQLQQSDDKPVVMRAVRQGGADRTGVDRWELSDTHLCAMVEGPQVVRVGQSPFAAAGRAPNLAFPDDRFPILLSCGALPTRFDQAVQLYPGQVLHGTPETWMEAGWNNWFGLSGNVVCSTLRKHADPAAAVGDGQRLYCGKLPDGGGATRLIEEKIQRAQWAQSIYKLGPTHLCGQGGLPLKLWCGVHPNKPEESFELKPAATSSGAHISLAVGGGINSQNLALSRTHVCVSPQNKELFCGELSSSGDSVILSEKVSTAIISTGGHSNPTVVLNGGAGLFFDYTAGPYSMGRFYLRDENLTIKKLKSGDATNYPLQGIDILGYRYQIIERKLFTLDHKNLAKDFVQLGSVGTWKDDSLAGNDDYACGIQRITTLTGGTAVGSLWCWPHQTYESPQEE